MSSTFSEVELVFKYILLFFFLLFSRQKDINDCEKGMNNRRKKEKKKKETETERSKKPLKPNKEKVKKEKKKNLVWKGRTLAFLFNYQRIHRIEERDLFQNCDLMTS